MLVFLVIFLKPHSTLKTKWMPSQKDRPMLRMFQSDPRNKALNIPLKYHPNREEHPQEASPAAQGNTGGNDPSEPSLVVWGIDRCMSYRPCAQVPCQKQSIQYMVID